MPCKALAVLGLLAVAAAEDASQANAAHVTPVQKVIQLLEGMIAKGTKEKQEEEIQFATYKAFCDATTKDKEAAIAAANKKVEVLQADIAKYESDAETLALEIEGLDADISTWEKDTEAANKVRTIENNDYTKTHRDYTESIEALHTGVETLRAQNHDLQQAGASLVQVQQMAFITPEARSVIQNFLSQDSSIHDENLAVAAPEAAGFESQLQGIIDMLEGLAMKFEDERTSLEKEEVGAKQAFDMLTMDLASQKESAEGARTEKSEAKAKALQDAADSRGGLADVTTTRDDDSKYLADLTANCQLKSQAFEDRQVTRKGEIDAITKAIEILSGKAVSGAAEKHLPQLLQSQAKAAALAQLRHSGSSPSQLQVAEFLNDQALKLNSRVLSMLATRVAADPFKKVKKMIKDLIVKLMEQANEEAETKGFCDKEMTTNEHTRKEKTAMVEQLSADIDELSSSIAVLAEELGKLTKELAALEEAMAQATSIRMTEKAKNYATIQDAKDAQEAVNSATAVLRDFYDKAADATALNQQPEIFDDKPYTGLTGMKGGIVGMLEVIESDFVRLESETSAQEESAEKEYQSYMKEATMDKAQMSKDVEHKTEKKTIQEAALQEKKTDMAGTQKELDAAMETFEKLKPTCVGGGAESYEDRVAQRKEEIESLQEALRILNGEDIALFQARS